MQSGCLNYEDADVIADILKQNGFDHFFSRSAVTKAKAYQADDRVNIVETDDRQRYIRAYVDGSDSEPYQVEISLKLRDGRLVDVIGDCDCPMGYNCKHVAATLFEIVRNGADQLVEAETASTRPRLGEQPSLPGLRPLPPELNSWLQKIGGSERGDDYPPHVLQRVIYCLKPHGRGARMPHLGISALSVRLLKDGTFSDKASQANVAGFNSDAAPAYFRDADIEIVGALSRVERTYDQPDVYPLGRGELLQQIVGTGRAYWLDHNGQPLQWGEARAGRIEWRQTSQAGVAPYLVVDGATTLRAAPPVYVDLAARVVGVVETGLPPRLAYQLLSAPFIPRAEVDQVARCLAGKLQSLDHAFLPVPPAPAIKIDAKPVPVLRLITLREEGYSIYQPRPLPFAEPSFRYGPIEVTPKENDQREAFLDGQVYEVERDRAMERKALARLKDFGFVKAVSVNPYQAAGLRDALTFRAPHQWLDFLNLHVRKLRDDGFEINVDEDFLYRLADAADAVDVELQSSGIDWFELELGIEVDGERRDLTATLAKLIADPEFDMEAIRGLAASGRHFYLPLADGRHVALAASRLLPVVLALHGLHLNGAVAEDTTKLKLGRAEVLPLMGLESEEFRFKGGDNLRRLAELLRSHDPAAIELPAEFRATLRPYQAYGLAWLDLLRESGLGGVLADDMGLGKTLQILALLALEKARGNLDRPALVIAPTSLMINWAAEARKFAPDLKVLVLHGSDRKQRFGAISEHDLVLTTYPLIARDRDVLLSREWHMAVLDEAQTVKNPDAATTRWLREIKAKHRFCLTGTPMENHLGELWSIMSIVNPGYLADKASFSRLWRVPIEKRGDKVRAAALSRRVKPFLLRRTKAEVATELPAKTEIVETIALEGAQRELYDSIRLSMSQKVRKAIAERGLAKSHIVVLEALLRMRQVCCDPALLKLNDGIERPSAKLSRLMEMVLELLSEGRKIIVFSQFASMLELVRRRFEEEGLRYSVLTGQTKDRKREIEEFQEGSVDVFLISLKAGGVGLNLTAADTVVIFDPWWNPAVEEQAIDRAYRIGQDKAVFVYRLVAAGTIEEKMDELKARKRALADGLFDRDGGIASALTEDDVQALFEP